MEHNVVTWKEYELLSQQDLSRQNLRFITRELCDLEKVIILEPWSSFVLKLE